MTEPKPTILNLVSHLRELAHDYRDLPEDLALSGWYEACADLVDDLVQRVDNLEAILAEVFEWPATHVAPDWSKRAYNLLTEGREKR